MFYEFHQNNSGGSFVRTELLDRTVIIEAHNVYEAMDRANYIGIYFNGVNEGIDCPCCGDRWYEPWDSDTRMVPTHYNFPLTLTNSSTEKNPDEHTVVIHYLDGRIIYTTEDT